MTIVSTRLHSKKETARLLAISLRHLDNLIKGRAIAHIRIGRAVRFSAEAIQEFKQSRTVKAIA